MRAFILLTLLSSGVLAMRAVGTAQTSKSAVKTSQVADEEDEEDDRCDFSDYNPLRISHPLVDAATKKVQPAYPNLAKAAHVGGEVEVRILVDREGEVIQACAAKGPLLLQAAAQNAAMQWEFKRNFGFTNKPKRRYVESVILFNFRLDDDKAAKAKN